LQLAALSFSSQSEKSRVIVLITDGENHEDDAIAAAQMAKEQGIRIYTIGIGTPEGAPIEIGGEFVKDENNEIVVSKLGEQMLQEMATITEGAYVRASKQDIGLDEVVKSINQMEKSELSTVRYEEYNEQYQYPLAVAMVLLLLEFIVLSRRNPRLRKFNIFRDKN
jgi:Ca-activated chloride channel family protein